MTGGDPGRVPQPSDLVRPANLPAELDTLRTDSYQPIEGSVSSAPGSKS
ncbi:hypothetical protein ACVBEQ_04725 [Nakamurella sp. GG22]